MGTRPKVKAYRKCPQRDEFLFGPIRVMSLGLQGHE